MNEDYFLAGGLRDDNYLKNLWRITVRAEIHELKLMPMKKSGFPMTYFKKIDVFITLEGWNGKRRLREVT